MTGGGVGPGMVSPQQAMFMQQQAMGPRGPFSQQGPGGVLQGPLAYLEKTTSNIGTSAFKICISIYVWLQAWRMGEGDAGAGGGEVEAGAEVEVVAAGLCQIMYPRNDPPPEVRIWRRWYPDAAWHSSRGRPSGFLYVYVVSGTPRLDFEQLLHKQWLKTCSVIFSATKWAL